MNTTGSGLYRYVTSTLCMLLGSAVVSTVAAQHEELRAELVNQRIAELRKEGETPENNTAMRAYQEALNWLREAQGQQQLAENYTAELNSSAQKEAELRERLEEASNQPEAIDPNQLQKLDWDGLNEMASNYQASLADLVAERDGLAQQMAAEAANVETARSRLAEIEKLLAGLPKGKVEIDPKGMPSQFEASQAEIAAQRLALAAERAALNAQIASQPARSRIRRINHDALVQNIEVLREQVNQVAQAMATRRPTLKGANTELAKNQVPGHQVITQLAEENKSLAEHQAELANRLATADQQKSSIDSKLFELMEQFNSARRLVDTGGAASVYGPFLMSYYLRLDQYRPPPRRSRDHSEVAEIVVDRARHEQQLAAMLSTTEFIQSRLEEAGLAGALPGEITAPVEEQVQQRRALLAELMSSETRLVQLLGKIDLGYEQLDALANEFDSFLIGHILWVRSHLPMNRNFFSQAWVDFKQAWQSLQSSARFTGGILPVAAMLAGLLSLLMRRRMWQRMQANNVHVGRPREDSIIFSLENLLLTTVRSAAIPLLMVGIALSINSSNRGFLQPAAQALLLASAGICAAFFLRDASAGDGLFRRHFAWPDSRCDAVLSLMNWWLVRLMPVALVTSFLVHLEQNTPHAVLGRVFLCIAALMMAGKVLRMLRKQHELHPRSTVPPGLQKGLVWAFTAFLIYIVISGFLLPARIIYYSLASSVLCFIALVILHEMLMRWTLVARRNLRFQQLLATTTGAQAVEDADRAARSASLEDLSDSTSQLFHAMVYLLGVVAIVWIWAPLMPAIQGLQKFTLWTVTQTVNGEQLQTQITIATIVLAILIFMVTFYAARRLPALIELVMRSTGNASPSTRYTVSTLTNYVIIAIGTMVFFSTLKMSWSQLQWLVAALGVGIGFGLQEIVANFISGLIILFERPIRVGDVVTIGESSGKVTRIQIRATTIRDWDGKELLVPNKEFVTGRLLNWTLSDNTNRILIEVGVAYGTDVKEAMRILGEVVQAHPAVLDDPKPNILFTQFGDNALQLSARCFLSELEDRLLRVSELHQQVYDAFNEAGIVIAFPQIDVHMDPDSPLTVRLENSPGKAPDNQ